MRNIHKNIVYYANSVGLDEQKDIANSNPKIDLFKWKEYRESKNHKTVPKAIPLRKQWRLIDLRPTIKLLSDEDNIGHLAYVVIGPQ